MNKFTNDKIISLSKSRGWLRIKRICLNYENKYGVDANLLIAIYTIESFFRPLKFRICEYFIVFLAGIRCLLLGISIKNYTIGTCQLGLATILNFYGGNVYKHSYRVIINTFSELIQIFSILFIDRSIEILTYRLIPIIHKAHIIYPDEFINRVKYIGEQYNGRYSYGLMLTDVYRQLKKVT